MQLEMANNTTLNDELAETSRNVDHLNELVNDARLNR
jgi:hypothetical protein